MSRLKGDPGYRAGWCVHYRELFSEGVGRIKDRGHRACEAGVVFADLERPWPCFLDKDTLRPKPGASHCECLRPPTRDEVAAHEEWFAGRMARMAKVFEVVAPWRAKYKGKSFAEVIPCPLCAGQLHLSITACNGHVHGNCETEGCVSWME